jgi:hypothetical protein
MRRRVTAQRALCGLCLAWFMASLSLALPCLAEEAYTPYDTRSGEYQLVPSNQTSPGQAQGTSPYDNPPGYDPARIVNPRPKAPWWKFWHKESPPPPAEQHTQVGPRKYPSQPYALLRVGAPVWLATANITLPTGFYMVEPVSTTPPLSGQLSPLFTEADPLNPQAPKAQLRVAIKRAGLTLAELPVALTTASQPDPTRLLTQREVNKLPLAVKPESTPLRNAWLTPAQGQAGWLLHYQVQQWTYVSQPLHQR